jgi:septal ring factor EnvC (AmiA/AmiB activator)
MSETLDENKPSQMIRVPTPLIPAVRELSRLHRQGRTSEVLQCLDELILALDNSSGYSTSNATSQTLSAIYERLDNLESQLLGEEPRNETSETKRLASLEQKIEGMTSRMAQFADAIIQIQNNLNNQPKRNKSYYNNSYYPKQTTRIQPLTEDNLAKRLGVNVETVRKERSSQPPPLFVGWSKRKDSSGIGWEFNEKTGLYHPVS